MIYIEAELRGLAIKKHILYELLTDYLSIREQTIGNNLEIEQLKRDYTEIQNQLWTLKTINEIGRGNCQDKISVTFNHSYNQAIFNQSAFQSISKTLTNLEKDVNEKHVLLSHSAECAKSQIRLYLQRITSYIVNKLKLHTNSPVVLNLNEEKDLSGHISELRLCISILFNFQRKFIRDQQFVKDTREWLSNLVAILLRIASYQDHLFILNHILRCPLGVGSWGSCFIQVPLADAIENPFSDVEINHALAILWVILSPIKQREKFLEGVSQLMKGAQEGLWVVVDSEGEEDEENTGLSLRENDLVFLLNQIPFEKIFSSILSINAWKRKDSLETSPISEHHVLKLFAFLTVLVKTFKNGLETYQQPKYHQFAKRLSRFIAHVMQYATELFEQFLRTENFHDSAMMERLRVEYDAFFLRAIFYLFATQKLGSWQFLSIVPFGLISESCLWKCFYLIHDIQSEAGELDPFFVQEHMEDTADQNFNFAEKMSNLSEVDGYYLLNTFSNMAINRDEVDFIKAVCSDLLQVGFICEGTRDNLAKSTRILLAELSLHHTFLLSDILYKVAEYIDQLNDLAVYLFEELPLSVWKINPTELSTISRLLINDDVDRRGKLARMIISRLNWGFNSDGTLFLAHEIHKEVAILVLKAFDHEPKYNQWCWQTVLRLKLHFNDGGVKIGNILDIEQFDIVLRGVENKKLLHCFVALLMTSWGHLIPLVCSRGLNLILLLQNSVSQQKYDAALFAVYQIFPLFLDCQECLINCTEFQDILTNFLNADSGYISKAKSLIVEQNTILRQFGNMIHAQIANFQTYNLASPRYLCKMWVNALISTPNWSKNYSVLFLLDVIIQQCFLNIDSLVAVNDLFKDIIQCSTPPEQSGKISLLFRWISTSNQDMTLITSSLSQFPWLAYVIIDIEFEEKENKTGLWKELLLQLNLQKGKANVDAAIKKAASIVEINSLPSASLCIYRWAQQAMDTALHHPLLPLIWHKFFILYLARLPDPRKTADLKNCVGEKFFEGIVNFSYLKRMKNRLQETVSFYEELRKEDKISDVQKRCLKLFRALELWLEEPRLHDSNFHLPSFPPHYETNLLQIIFKGDKSPWWEFFDSQILKKQEFDCVRLWRATNFRDNKSASHVRSSNNIKQEPIERIYAKLKSYAKPKSPPLIVQTTVSIDPIDLGSGEKLIWSLKPSFHTLNDFARNHQTLIYNYKSLNDAYKVLVPKLYRSVTTKIRKLVPCQGNQAVRCSGSAIIEMHFNEARINEKINHEIEVNRLSYESLISETLQNPAVNLCTSSATIQHAIRLLQEQYQADKNYWEIGAELFYYILTLLSNENMKYLPTKSLYSDCLSKLGKTFICGVEYEIPRLLDKILEKPSLYNYLAPHFSPINVNTANLLLMYSKISESTLEPKIILALLSTFNINDWLLRKKPKLCQRTQFIEYVLSALFRLGPEPPIEMLILHEMYRKNLVDMLEFQFPEHYGEILVNLMQRSIGGHGNSGISISVWDDVLNAVTYPVRVNVKASMGDQLRLYGQTQQKLQYREIIETCDLLASHFTTERLQNGHPGLYTKYQFYIEVYALFLGLMSHALTVKSLNVHQGLMADKLCEKIWPYIRNLFVPWIAPYALQNIKENEVLPEDHAVLLPWQVDDVKSVKVVLKMFVESISFVTHVLPASNIILNYIWQWYATSYAHGAVKEYILDLIHYSLIVLPWHNFFPSFIDLEYMIQVLEQYLPECHMFLGHVFVQIDWINWISNFPQCPTELKAKIYQYYVNLLVKLSNEPSVRSNYVSKINILLVQSEKLDWSILEPSMFHLIMDWYIMSCDSVVIFKTDPTDVDYRVLQFLTVVSGYDKKMEVCQISTINKRTTFVKSYVKLLSVFSSRHKTVALQRKDELASMIQNQLLHLDKIVSTDEERETLLIEFLQILNINNANDVALKCISQWIAGKSGNAATIKIILQVAGKIIVNSEYLAGIFELAIMNYFQNNVDGAYNPDWLEITNNLNVQSSRQTELESVLLNKGCVLTLNTILLQRMKTQTNHEVLLNHCIQWIENLKINETVEDKVPLLWYKILRLSLKLSSEDESSARYNLNKFSHILIDKSGDKQESGWGWGLLKAVGLNRQSNISLGFRFLCRALAGYILAQLPDKKESQFIRKFANAPSRVGESGGNSECSQILLKLDFGQTQGKIKECAQLALNKIQNSENSLHNVHDFLLLLTSQFYNKVDRKSVV